MYNSTLQAPPGESLFQRDGIQGGVEYGRISIAVAADGTGNASHSYDPAYLQVHEFVCVSVCV
jgi:hypothetical protein